MVRRSVRFKRRGGIVTEGEIVDGKFHARRSVSIDDIARGGYREMLREVGEDFGKTIRRTARPSGGRRISAWPIGDKPQPRSAHHFKVRWSKTKGRGDVWSTKWIIASNPAPYARGVERGYFRELDGYVRKPGNHLKKLWTKTVRERGKRLAEDHWAQGAERVIDRGR